MKKYEAPVMSLFYAESKDIITVSRHAVGYESDIEKIELDLSLLPPKN